MKQKLPTMEQPIANLGARIVLMGDTDIANSHVLDAKKFLAEIRQGQGINVAVDNGQVSWHAMSRILPDGTRIRVQHEPCFDTITIEGPIRQTPEFPGVDDAYTPRADLEFTPWFWAGVRHVSGGFEDYLSYAGGAEWHEFYTGVNDPGRVARPHLCVWEPKAGSNGREFNIVSNRDYLYRDWYGLEDDGKPDPKWYPIGANRWVYGINSDESPDSEEITLKVIDGTTRKDDGNVYSAYYQGEPFLDEHDGEKPGDYYWDVVIKSTAYGIAIPGTYFVKVAITGWDGIPVSKSEFIVKVMIGVSPGMQTSAEYKITQEQPNYTTMRRATIPGGFFYGEKEGGQAKIDEWYYGFWFFHPSIIDYGTNPHGDNWWQGGFEIFMPARDNLISHKNHVTGPMLFLVTEDSEDYPLIPPTGFALENDDSTGDVPINPPGDSGGEFPYFDNVEGFPEWRLRSPGADTVSVALYRLVISLNVISQRVEMEGYWRNDIKCFQDQSGAPGLFTIDPFQTGQVLAVHWSGLGGMSDQSIPFMSDKSGRAFNTVVGGGAYLSGSTPSSGISDSVLAMTSTLEPCLGGKQGSVPPIGADFSSNLIDPFYAVVEVTMISTVPDSGVGNEEGGRSGRYIGPNGSWKGDPGSYEMVTGTASDVKLYLTGWRYR